MPFTIAHPAAVLPLRRWLIFSSLVMGALSPDFHYYFGLHYLGRRYLGLPINSEMSHNLGGAFYFCLPLGLVALWVFHRLLKLPLISLAPQWHQARLARFAVPFRFGPAKRLLLILTSLLLGIFSHLLWDSFTHDHGWMVRQFPAMRTVVFPQFMGGRPLFNVFQHASTLLGMAILAVAYTRWSQKAQPQPAPRILNVGTRTKVAVITGTAITAFLLSGLYGLYRFAHSGRLAVFAAYTSISFVSLTLLCMLAFSLWWHYRSRQVDSSQ